MGVDKAKEKCDISLWFFRPAEEHEEEEVGDVEVVHKISRAHEKMWWLGVKEHKRRRCDNKRDRK